MTPAAVQTNGLDEIQRMLSEAARAEGQAFSRDVLAVLRKCGAARRPHLEALKEGSLAEPARALADCVHFLAILHGELPSVFELAQGDDSFASGWLGAVAHAFESDRRWLGRLVVATGTALDLAGLTATEQLIRDLRMALLTLGRSSRRGCAFGAAVMLAEDWAVLRTSISALAVQIHGEQRAAPTSDWPIGGVESALSGAASAIGTRRAITFGALQLAGLHGQLFDLLEARHAVRLS